MDFMDVANGLGMWLAVTPPIIYVAIQAIIFWRKAIKAGADMGMTKKQLTSATRAAAIASIGPSLAVFAGMVALMLIMGGPLSWMRNAYIGSVQFESASYTTGLTIAGGSPDNVTLPAFVNGVWTMTIVSLGWIITSILFTDKMDLLQNKLAGGNLDKMKALANGAMVGALTSLSLDSVVRGGKNLVSSLGGLVVMIISMYLIKKYKQKWLTEWGLLIAIIVGSGLTMLF